MDKTLFFDLAYSFYGAKLWKHLQEEELFAVRLPGENPDEQIGYCYVMGKNGQHTALAVYRGTRGFSTYRAFYDVLMSGPDDTSELLIQDCIHCSFESKELLEPEELAEIRAYCQKTGKPVRAPFPKFTRYYPYCIPWEVTGAADWKAIETALRVAEKMAETLRRAGKAALGLRPVYVSTDDEAYPPQQMDLFSEAPADDEVTIPLYSIENDALVIERIPLPPYVGRTVSPPRRIDEKALAKLMRRRQEDVYECELIRLPEPVDGEPPYFPVVLLTLNGGGFMQSVTLGNGAVFDPDRMINDFIGNLGKTYPKAIRVRTEDTKTLLAEFCRRANILLVLSDDLEYMDEAIEDMLDQMEDDEDDFEDDLDDIVDMLSGMTIPEIRMMPLALLDQILAAASYFPPEIIKKVRKARGR